MDFIGVGVCGFIIGLLLGREWAEARLMTRLINCERDRRYWFEIAKRQSTENTKNWALEIPDGNK